MQDGAPPGTPFFCSPEVVTPLKGFDLFASDIETCKHVSASLGSFVIPASERESPSRIKKVMPHQVGHDKFCFGDPANCGETATH